MSAKETEKTPNPNFDIQKIAQSRLQPAESRSYPLKVDERIFNRLEKHLSVLKHTDYHSPTKQRWMIEAIKEKLEREPDLNSIRVPVKRILNFKIDKKLEDKVEQSLNMFRLLRHNFTKREWLLEAIQEKLDSEEYSTKKLFKKLE